MGQLEGKVAVITGAGTGLGAATARLFAAEGAAVTLVGRREAKLAEVASAIEADGGKALVVPGDVTLREAVALSGAPLLSRLAHVDEVAQFLLVLVGPTARRSPERSSRSTAASPRSSPAK